MGAADIVPHVLGVFFNGLCALSAVGTLSAVRRGGRSRLLDRWDALNRMGNTFFLLLLSLLMTTWAVFPDAVWYLVLALTAGAAAGVVLRWPELPVLADDRVATTRRVSAIGTLVFLAAAVVALLVFT
ncbi:hypothetical protein [Nocardiopsis halotolerans]|uniref:hypothetical protein n=1 Tax=Nocardiopsis halotolerans TaxID=124252 RepID=UPI000346059F|nr:hypothetical protein [Nocardiopsis halotolerans]